MFFIQHFLIVFVSFMKMRKWLLTFFIFWVNVFYIYDMNTLWIASSSRAIDHKFWISPLSPLFSLFQYISPLVSKFTCFLHTLCVSHFPPTLTIMHLWITQCTYWTPLSRARSNSQSVHFGLWDSTNLSLPDHFVLPSLLKGLYYFSVLHRFHYSCVVSVNIVRVPFYSAPSSIISFV